jgi:Fe2+ transport system protein B
MDENLNNDETLNVDDTTVETQAKQEEQVDEKKFTQKDIDRLITQRLSKQKQGYEKDIISYKEQVDKFSKVISSFVDKERLSIPENYLPLFDKLDVLEQYEFLTSQKSTKKTIPETPESETTPQKKTIKKLDFM